MAYMEGTGHIWRWQDLQNKETNLRTKIMSAQLHNVIKIYIRVSYSFQLNLFLSELAFNLINSPLHVAQHASYISFTFVQYCL